MLIDRLSLASPARLPIWNSRPEGRMRLGDWRVISTIDDSAKLVRIALIAARESAYK